MDFDIGKFELYQVDFFNSIVISFNNGRVIFKDS